MRKRLAIVATIMFITASIILAAIVTRPFERGSSYRGIPVSYWRQAVSHYMKSGNRIATGRSLIARLEIFLRLRDRSSEPMVLSGDRAAAPVLLELIRDDDRDVWIQAELAL